MSVVKTVFVGLSGGVDSAVSAALLREQGYEVRGVFIRIVVPGYPCTAGEDKISAMRVAAHLKIPFEEVDLSREYTEKVFADAVAGLRAGITPNPDALCNKEIKFGIFFDWCVSRGADYVATGHYAQVKDGLLYKGADQNKDQSYFLWAVPGQKLARTLFPIGHMEKLHVRARAAALGLPNADRKDSQGLCFLGPLSLHELVEREASPAPGDVLGEDGRVVGRHTGVAQYTLGQRHGFNLYAHQPHTPPHYVIAKDVRHNTITVSVNKIPQAQATRVHLRDTNWIGDTEEGPCDAQYRYRQAHIPATFTNTSVELLGGHYVPEGQSLVLYRGERCLGGGVVDSVELRA